MNRKDLLALWNDRLAADEDPIRTSKREFPWYGLELTKAHLIDRRYSDGGIRYRTEIRLKGAAICLCAKEEDELAEEMHRRVSLLCDCLPAPVGNEELLFCEMLQRPAVISRIGGAVVLQTTLRLTLKKEGKPRGIVFFFGQDRQTIYSPVGFFAPLLEQKGKQILSQYYDERSVRAQLYSGEEKLRFSFDRMIGAVGQELLLLLSDQQARGTRAVVQVFFADADAEEDGILPCVCLPMSVKIDRMETEDAGIVFGGEFAANGKKQSGILQKDKQGAWRFSAR